MLTLTPQSMSISAGFFYFKHIYLARPIKLSRIRPYCLQQSTGGDSLEEQLGQRLLRMPPPAVAAGRLRQPAATLRTGPVDSATFRLPQEASPQLTSSDAMQVSACCGMGGLMTERGLAAWSRPVARLRTRVGAIV